MSPRRAGTLAVWLLGLGSACGPGVDLSDSTPGSSGAADDTTAATVTSTPMTSTATQGGTAVPTDTGEVPPGGYEDDDGGTGCTFTCPDPPPPPIPPGTGGGGGFRECDLLAQDCPEGEKCMPWASDGGSQWNGATRCAPLADDPGQDNDDCIVEGSGVSGIDTCDLGVVCWGVDPLTNEGTCTPLCTEVLGNFFCDDPADECGMLPGNVPLCVNPCDPIADTCGAGQGCYLLGSDFMCLAEPDLPPLVGEPCSGTQSCAAGHLCAYGPAFACGGEAGQGCCAALCDVNGPAGSTCGGPALGCLPWFPDPPPPEYAHVGVCELPA